MCPNYLEIKALRVWTKADKSSWVLDVWEKLLQLNGAALEEEGRRRWSVRTVVVWKQGESSPVSWIVGAEWTLLEVTGNGQSKDVKVRIGLGWKEKEQLKMQGS